MQQSPSGAKSERVGLNDCLKVLVPGDILLVWRLDRLGRSMSHLVNLIETLINRGIGFKSICDGAIDTTTAYGELIFNIFSALSHFERKLIQERTRAGLEAARARRRKGGRKPIWILMLVLHFLPIFFWILWILDIELFNFFTSSSLRFFQGQLFS